MSSRWKENIQRKHSRFFVHTCYLAFLPSSAYKQTRTPLQYLQPSSSRTMYNRNNLPVNKHQTQEIFLQLELRLRVFALLVAFTLRRFPLPKRSVTEMLCAVKYFCRHKHKSTQIRNAQCTVACSASVFYPLKIFHRRILINFLLFIINTIPGLRTTLHATWV